MQNKKYIVRATADIAVTVETSTPENVKELLESALMDLCDISAKVKNISLTDFDTVVHVAAEKNIIKPGDIARLIAFRNNPSDISWINGGNN